MNIHGKSFKRKLREDEDGDWMPVVFSNWADKLSVSGNRVLWALVGSLEYFPIQDLTVDGKVYLFIKTNPEEISKFLGNSVKFVENGISQLIKFSIIKTTHEGYIVGEANKQVILYCESKPPSGYPMP